MLTVSLQLALTFVFIIPNICSSSHVTEVDVCYSKFKIKYFGFKQCGALLDANQMAEQPTFSYAEYSMYYTLVMKDPDHKFREAKSTSWINWIVVNIQTVYHINGALRGIGTNVLGYEVPEQTTALHLYEFNILQQEAKDMNAYENKLTDRFLDLEQYKIDNNLTEVAFCQYVALK